MLVTGIGGNSLIIGDAPHFRVQLICHDEQKRRKNKENNDNQAIDESSTMPDIFATELR